MKLKKAMMENGGWMMAKTCAERRRRQSLESFWNQDPLGFVGLRWTIKFIGPMADWHSLISTTFNYFPPLSAIFFKKFMNALTKNPPEWGHLLKLPPIGRANLPVCQRRLADRAFECPGGAAGPPTGGSVRMRS
jgi:hypothetical protein